MEFPKSIYQWKSRSSFTDNQIKIFHNIIAKENFTTNTKQTNENCNRLRNILYHKEQYLLYICHARYIPNEPTIAQCHKC